MTVNQQALGTLLKAARRIKEINEAQRLEDSFYEFVKAAWSQFDPADFVDNWHLEDICLPYQAQVVTRTGTRAIGEIVETGWSGDVLSFNHLTNELEFKRIGASTSSRPKKLVSVVTADGNRLSCTDNHPIFVKGRGYVPAGLLRAGDVLFTVPELLRKPAEDRQKILFEGMSPRAYSCPNQSGKIDPLRALREIILSLSIATARQVLQHALFWGSKSSAGKANVPSVRSAEGVGQRKILSRMLAIVTPSARENVPVPSVRCHGLPQSGSMGFDQPAIGSVLWPFLPWPVRAGTEQHGLYRRAKSGGLSEELSEGTQAGARTGWPSLLSLFRRWTPRRSSYQPRQAGQSNGQLGVPMSAMPQSSKGSARRSYAIVESVVSAVEQEIRLPAKVYNIEVEGNNNYIADGILVHNCDHMEAVARGHISRLLLNEPPRTGKTAIVSVCFCPWVWAQREKGPLSGPHVSFFYASYAEQLSLEHSLKTRRLIESRWYQKHWGHRFKLASDRNTKGHFENDKGGYRMASSVDARATGYGADVLVADDPHLVKEAESDLVREGVVRWWTETMPSRLNNRRTGAMIVVMQRVHEGDLSGDILASDRGYVHFCVPMSYVPCQHVNAWVGDKIETIIGDDVEDLAEDDIFWVDRRTEEGQLLWPERFPASEVIKLEKELGPYAFAGQYQQVPSPRGGGIIREEWWQPWNKEIAEKNGCVPEKYPGFEFILASLDSAFTEKEENDPSALSIWGMWRDPNGNPMIFLMFCWDERYQIHDLVRRVGEDCKRFKVDRLIIEDKASGHSVSQEMARLFGSFDFGIELVNPRTGFIKSPDKVARMQTVVHLFAEGLVFAPDKSWADRMIKQCAMVPRSIHDDLADSMSQALIWLRRSGWAQRKEEVAMEAEDETKYRPRMGSLYPV